MSLGRNQHSQDPPEQQHLLPQGSNQQHPIKHGRTPLPLFQLSILLYQKFCQALARYVIEPFINELLLSFAGGDEGTVAYLASIMDAGLYATSLSTILYWNRLSDTVGRKPIMILGMIATTVSILLVGVSTTFWAFVVSRCISSALDQSAPALRCAVSEMTDESNSTDAFALLNIAWALGMVIGPLVGGHLSNPHIRFPEVFSGGLWEQLPYLLPCTTIVLVTTPGLLTLCACFRETLPRLLARDGEALSREQTPIRSLFIPRVTLAMANYARHSFLHTAYTSIFSLFLAMSPSVGGLGLPTAQIGLILAARGLSFSFAQALLIGPAVRRFSLGRVFTTAMMSHIPSFLIFPLMNVYAKDALANDNLTSRSIMWTLLTLQLVFVAMTESGYTCVYMYVFAAAPSRRTLGAVNGLAEVLVMGAKLAGSTFTTFMLGVSIKRGWMGGYAVYVLFSITAYGAVILARRLPRHAKEWSDGGA